MSKYTREQIDELCNTLYRTMESLVGACDALDMDYDELSDENFEQIDEEVFCCEGCGWWEHVGEGVWDVDSRELLCSDCAAENESDEDFEDD